MVGGYVPQPLSLLLPDMTGSSELPAPLALPCLHVMGRGDEAVPMAKSMELVQLFEEASRMLLVHDNGHIVPQQGRNLDRIREFIMYYTAGVTQAIPAAVAPAEPPPPSNPLVETAPSGPQHEASEQQVEEMAALEAIFGEEYRLISTAPPRFAVALRQSGDSELISGPPSRHFKLVFLLPQGYPGSTPPDVHIEGPLGGNDPDRQRLHDHIMSVAAEMTASGDICVYQMVEAGREWIDANLPADLCERRAGAPASAEVSSTATEGRPADAAPEDSAPTGTSPGPWYNREEADDALVHRATIEAVAASAWRCDGDGEAGERPGGAEDDASVHELAQRGRWDYVVGLVGKPSAGKSTFFNAVTDPVTDEEGARVGAFPFTTIQPNVGRGFCLLPDPATQLGLDPSTCKPAHGHALAFDLANIDPRFSNLEPLQRLVHSCGWTGKILWRRVPVTVKDVAGLVPGAYKGLGRGNAFLNDLCDADVLVHVVDVSGSTDRKGDLVEAGQGGDPLDDIGWVREELHRWIYDNLRGKWQVVLRKPARLPAMFSGYHASRALVESVLHKVGIAPGSLVVEGASLNHWGEWEVHRLVAHFLAARFPILLALNKADMSSSADHLRRVRAALPMEPAVAVSAATERWLAQQRRCGAVSYQDGASTATLLDSSLEELPVGRRLAEANANVLQRYGGTGALLALTCAVALRPPRCAFPVADLESLTALPSLHVSPGTSGVPGASLEAKARALEGRKPSVLRDCVLVKPGSTVEDLCQVLKGLPYQLLEGDFVRAECRITGTTGMGGDGAAPGAAAARHTSRMARKDEVIGPNNCVIKIMTNKRSQWQGKNK